MSAFCWTGEALRLLDLHYLDWTTVFTTRSMRPVVCEVRVSKVTAHVVRFGPAEHTWYEQQESIEDIQISLQGKKKTEKHSVQTLSAMVRAAKCGTPGDEKMIFVLREFSDETSWSEDKN